MLASAKKNLDEIIGRDERRHSIQSRVGISWFFEIDKHPDL